MAQSRQKSFVIRISAKMTIIGKNLYQRLIMETRIEIFVE